MKTTNRVALAAASLAALIQLHAEVQITRHPNNQVVSPGAHVTNTVTASSTAPPLTDHTAEVMPVEFSPDGEQVLTGSADGTAKLWESATGQLRHTFEQHTPGDLATSPVRDRYKEYKRTQLLAEARRRSV